MTSRYPRQPSEKVGATRFLAPENWPAPDLGTRAALTYSRSRTPLKTWPGRGTPNGSHIGTGRPGPP